MLDENTEKELSSLGIDPVKLAEAIADEKTVSLELSKYYTQEEFDTLSRNRFEEGKNALSEIKAKEIKKKFGVELDSKDLDVVVDELINKTKASSGADTLAEDLRLVREQFESYKLEAEQKLLDKDNENFLSGVDSKLLSYIPDKTKIPREDILELYKMKTNIVNIEGTAGIVEDGEVLKDAVRNPVSLKKHFSAFLDKSNYLEQGGINTKDSRSKQERNDAPFSSREEFMEYCKENGKNPLDRDMQSLYIKSRKHFV